MSTYYPAFICYMMSFLITYPATTAASSWYKTHCKAPSFFPRKMEMHSQSLPYAY